METPKSLQDGAINHDNSQYLVRYIYIYHFQPLNAMATERVIERGPHPL